MPSDALIWQVRILVDDDDPDPANHVLDDVALAFYLTQNGDNVWLAGADAADKLAIKYAGSVDRSVEDISIKDSQKSKNYAERAAMLRKRAKEKTALSVTAYAGGISIADKDTQETDTDRVRPAFRRDTHRHDGYTDAEELGYV